MSPGIRNFPVPSTTRARRSDGTPVGEPAYAIRASLTSTVWSFLISPDRTSITDTCVIATAGAAPFREEHAAAPQQRMSAERARACDLLARCRIVAQPPDCHAS